MKLALSPQEAWQPLPAGEWDEDAARHLLRRAGWSARPAEVARTLADGLVPTLERLFPATPPAMPTPPSVVAIEEDTPEFAAKVRAAPPVERRELYRLARERSRNALFDLTPSGCSMPAGPTTPPARNGPSSWATSTWSPRRRCRTRRCSTATRKRCAPTAPARRRN